MKVTVIGGTIVSDTKQLKIFTTDIDNCNHVSCRLVMNE